MVYWSRSFFRFASDEFSLSLLVCVDTMTKHIHYYAQLLKGFSIEEPEITNMERT